MKKYILYTISSLSLNVTITLAFIASGISIFAFKKASNKILLLFGLGMMILAIFMGLFYLEEIVNLLTEYTNLLTNNVLIGNNIHMITPGGDFPVGDSPVDPLPGVKCPECLKKGTETWVLPGKHCPKCGHPC